MTEQSRVAPAIGRRRRERSLVDVRPDWPGGPLPALVEAAVPDLDLAGWLAGRRDELLRDLDAHSAVLFCGFEVASADDFSRAARAVTPDLLGYLERAAPRTEVADRVFTSTEFNAEQWIPLHHEMSYWPTHLYFWCAQPSPW
ncbi:transcriptional regulator [Micromonospora sp. ATCC 39149]|uniref:TauD/TfdA-like domain-containing protein n=1 Tax=Micromonospora carbonacea TaxID=47853 RepID=A0A7D5Y6A4_9ACTN|nr:transcriptional regulator [Micromonospora sp. ATCC 39149]EEP69946.1 transcriptional regulator [Micromonospora sp. ATCC 39149]QLJ96399.1 hypothetical protein HZU44_15605 [Micromonospora carbonacea]